MSKDINILSTSEYQLGHLILGSTALSSVNLLSKLTFNLMLDNPSFSLTFSESSIAEGE